jgi:hypothetical protein
MKTFTTRHDGFPPPLVAWGSSRGAAAQSDTPATTLACALAWSPACLGSANHRSGSLSRCRKATLTNKVNRRQNQILLSRLRRVGCQLLPHVRLGNPELSRNPGWRDARRREQHFPDRASTKLWRCPLFLDEGTWPRTTVRHQVG